ncbi:Phage shock protein PspC (stress-responsive transcriptional regulator) [Catalinimonas alkaloidigena]|uniref:Phage shock protein PspC (Stress-responsive transcriptional regulator) n=1 Tax=Catalinimonas alkaloidigena TaxID=1075417 RepID=A0A1G9NCB9_9BACT|nr:Phage shock protein PspC (stress-responsive transcriptional regulator) [Catalinimonas alkaloidigena]
MEKIRLFFEDKAFGVCTQLSDKVGISTTNVRLFFIYASFLTLGSPVIMYLVLAFVLKIRQNLRRGHRTVWEI